MNTRVCVCVFVDVAVVVAMTCAAYDIYTNQWNEFFPISFPFVVVAAAHSSWTLKTPKLVEAFDLICQMCMCDYIIKLSIAWHGYVCGHVWLYLNDMVSRIYTNMWQMNDILYNSLSLPILLLFCFHTFPSTISFEWTITSIRVRHCYYCYCREVNASRVDKVTRQLQLQQQIGDINMEIKRSLSTYSSYNIFEHCV